MNQLLQNIQQDLILKAQKHNFVLPIDLLENYLLIKIGSTKIIIYLNKPEKTANAFVFVAENYAKQADLIWNKILQLKGFLTKIYARNCSIKAITKSESELFLNTNHLLGYCNSFYNYGMFYNQNLVMVALFSKAKIKKESATPYRSYQLVRLCSTNNFIVVGGLSKMLKFFITEYHVKHLMTYINLETDNGNAYLKFGFKKADYTGEKNNLKLIYSTLNF